MTPQPFTTDRDPGDEAPDSCGAETVANLSWQGSSRLVTCDRPLGHEGNHRAEFGSDYAWHWPQEPSE